MNRIKELRQKAGLTLVQLGQKVGMANNTLSQYETGKRFPKLKVWQKLADYFGVSVAYLQGKDEFKLYYFSQWEDRYGTYNEFTVLARSEDDAWKQIKEKMKEPEGYGTDYNGNTYPCYGTYEHNRSVYEVKCYPVDKPVVIRHFSAD